MSASRKVTQGVGHAWGTCPTLLRGIWARSRRGGFGCWGWQWSNVILKKIEYWCHWKSFFDFKPRFAFDKTLRERLQSFWRFHVFCSNGYLSAKVFPRTFSRLFILVNPCKRLPLCWTPTKTIEQFDASSFSETLLLLFTPCLKANCRQINSVYWSLQCIRSGIQKVRPKHFANICRF